MADSSSVFRILLGIIFVALTASCASTLSVRSQPSEATVSLVPMQDGPLKAVGKTPLVISTADLQKLYGGELASGHSLELVIEKPGYGTQHYLVPSTPFGASATALDVRLKEGAQDDRAATEVVSGLFRAQKLGLQGQFDPALAEVDRILVLYPKFGAALSMKASILFMKKDLPGALVWYEKALSVNPTSEETVKMIAYIRGSQGPGRLPSGGQK